MPHIPPAICANDGTEMTTEHTGVLIRMDTGGVPYYAVYADEYHCKVCNSNVYLPASEVVAEAFHPEFSSLKIKAICTFADETPRD